MHNELRGKKTQVKGSEHSSFLPLHSNNSVSNLPMWPFSGYSLPFCVCGSIISPSVTRSPNRRQVREFHPQAQARAAKQLGHFTLTRKIRKIECGSLLGVICLHGQRNQSIRCSWQQPAPAQQHFLLCSQKHTKHVSFSSRFKDKRKQKDQLDQERGSEVPNLPKTPRAPMGTQSFLDR